MSGLMGMVKRLRNTFVGWRSRERELDEELQFHLDHRIADYIRQGLTPADARRRALARFGSLARAREETRRADTLPWLDRIASYVQHVARALRRDPGFVVTATLTLALGIGANTAMFTLANALLYTPPSVREPERLVSVTASEGANRVPLMASMVERIADERVFDGLCGFLTLSVTVDIVSRVAPIQTHPMTGDCFTTLGIRPALGRLLNTDDERPGRPHVAVLTWDTWTHEYGGRDSVLTETINVDGTRYLIVGVSERGFTGLELGYPARVFIPFGNFADGLQGYFPPPDLMAMSLVARLPQDRTREEVGAQVRSRWRAWLEASASPRLPPRARQQYLERVPLVEAASGGLARGLRQQFATPVLALLAISAVVLLMTCVNAANLLLARATVRRKEGALRLALGASSGRLFREAVAESLAIVALAVGASIFLAVLVNDSLIAMFQETNPDFAIDVAPDGRVLTVTVLVGVVSWSLFALVPAWRASRVEVLSFASWGRGSTDHRRLRQVAVSAQVALTVLLLSTGALFWGTLKHFRELPLGLSVDRVLAAQLSALPGGYDQNFASGAHYRTVLDSVEARPEVESVALVRTAPLSTQSWKVPVAIAGSPVEVTMSQSFISDGFFRTTGIRLTDGRAFRRTDSPDSMRVAVLSDSAARALFGGASPVGRFIRVGTAPINHRVEVIGVAADAVLGTPQQAETQVVYLNFWQFGAAIQTYPTLLVKSKASGSFGVENLQPLIRASGREYVSQARTLEERLDSVLVKETLLAALTTAFAALGLGLAAVGLYGLLAFLVAARTPEIGIRMALGADRRRIAALVLGETAATVVAGAAAGSLMAWAVIRSISTALYQNDSVSLLPIAVGALLMAAVACAAAIVPARQAAVTDPVRALSDT